MDHRAILAHLMLTQPEATRAWAAAICAVPLEAVHDTFQRVDQSWISEKSVEFAMAVLKLNADTIGETCLG